ncbi:glutathione S-transferase [Ascosphaera apis ARSEF 7405]|uniref:Glutathione S-transferase n=1 Tax=Ascosphaera apis ARSEF 7405 TaxID=392613 RepID=A0A167WDN8_9EURO|nr:glutathione S-transferase [Ascosphaera apis ARSEF 7405]
MATITVPEGYGNVIAVALGLMPFLSFVHGAVVTGVRKNAKIEYPNTYATAQQCKESREAEKFNCAQRAHANLLENLPQTIITTLVAGLAYPQGATIAGLLWSIARVLFLQGYVWSGKPRGMGRFRGAWFWFPQIALWGMCVFGIGAPLMKSPF